MTISMRCAVCKSTDRRRLIELGWNDGMTATALSDAFGGSPGTATIIKHLKEHTSGGEHREIELVPLLPARERVIRLQQMQLDEVERRIQMAKERADAMNKERDGLTDANGMPFPMVDWSEFYDVLGKDMQAAIGSILKTQGLADKRDKAQGDLKLGLFEAMTNAGLAPRALVGGMSVPLLTEGDDD